MTNVQTSKFEKWLMKKFSTRNHAWRSTAYTLLGSGALFIEILPLAAALLFTPSGPKNAALLGAIGTADVLLLASLLWRKGPLSTRGWMGATSLFLFGTAVLAMAGPSSSGRSCMHAAALAACLFIDLDAGITLVAVNLASLLVMGLPRVQVWLGWPEPQAYLFWMIGAVTHTLIIGIMILALATIIRTLDQSLNELKNEHKELRNRLQIERALATAFGPLSKRPGETIYHALETIGEAMGVDRAYVFDLDQENQLWDNTHEWCAEGISSQLNNLQHLPVAEFHWWQETLSQNVPIVIDDTSQLASKAPRTHNLLTSKHTQSCLAVHLCCGDAQFGFIGLDAVREQRHWEPHDVAIMQSVANAIASSRLLEEEEEQLAEAKRMAFLLSQNAPIGIALLDENGYVSSSNQGVFEPGKAPPLDPGDCLLDYEPLLKVGFADQFERCLQDGKSATGEVRCPLAGHASRWARYNIVRLTNSSASDERMLLFIENTSHEHEMQEQLSEAQRMESLGRLAGGVAHDFNNLLTIINGYTELALDTLDDDHTIRPDLLAVAEAGERAAVLTRDLLQFGRGGTAQREQLDINALVQGATGLLEKLLTDGIELSLDIDDTCLPVETNAGEMEQVLMNLVVNARDAMPDGGSICISTSRVKVSAEAAAGNENIQPGGHAQIVVQDSGSGISPDVMAHLFEPFFTTKENGKGTGLGLATVYNIVKNSGGHIATESEPGQGTAFRINLPLAADVT